MIFMNFGKHWFTKYNWILANFIERYDLKILNLQPRHCITEVNKCSFDFFENINVYQSKNFNFKLTKSYSLEFE